MYHIILYHIILVCRRNARKSMQETTLPNLREHAQLYHGAASAPSFFNIVPSVKTTTEGSTKAADVRRRRVKRRAPPGAAPEKAGPSMKAKTAGASTKVRSQEHSKKQRLLDFEAPLNPKAGFIPPKPKPKAQVQ